MAGGADARTTMRLPSAGHSPRRQSSMRSRTSAFSGAMYNTYRVQGSGFRVQGLGFTVQGSGLRVQGSGFKGSAYY